MDSPVAKLGAYDLLVTLLPGVILVEALRAAGMPLISYESWAPYAVLAYVLGLLSSRLGSLLVSKVGAWVENVPQESDWYASFITAEKRDPKIQVLLQSANGYRSLCGAVLAYFLLIALWSLSDLLGIPHHWRLHISVAAFGAIFFVAYLKQNKYVRDRARANNDG